MTVSTPLGGGFEHHCLEGVSPLGTPVGSAKHRPVALLACTYCRYKHLKCDANVPTCGRCRLDDRDCQYLQSKRGLGRLKKSTDVLHAPNHPDRDDVLILDDMDTVIDDFLERPCETDSSLNAASGLLETTLPMPVLSESTIDQPLAVPGFTEDTIPSASTNLDLIAQNYLFDGVWDWFDTTNPSLAPEYKYNSVVSKRLLEVYYLHFHAAHPVLLPIRHQTRHLVRNYPRYLVAVMQCIGSQYESMALSEGYRDAISHMLANQAKRDGYLVQAMLIFSITLHAQDWQQQARQVLSSAIELAVNLGMNRRNFASDNSTGSPFLEESWRRTWWELYVLDGMLAALHQQSSFKLHGFENDVLLPCEDSDYSTGDSIPKAYTLDEFRDRAFCSQEIVHSSSAYRVEAVRILGTVLKLDRSIYARDSNETEAIEANLNSWLLCLPPAKRGVLGPGGKVDEMLFQAHMIINACTIYLHQPRSMITSSIQDTVTCTRQMRTTQFTTARDIHSAKTIQAANKLSDLILLPGSLTDHSPFFICTVALSAMVNLSAYALDFRGVAADARKERVILAAGALNRLGETWAAAIPILREVKKVARAVFRAETGNGHNLGWNHGDAEVRGIGNPLLDHLSWQDQVGNAWPDA